MAEDRILKCKDCGEQFTFTTGEQEFYAEKGFQNDPVRCAGCRRARKKERGSSGGSGNFRENTSYQGRPSRPNGYDQY